MAAGRPRKTKTPWGDAESLRSRRLSPGSRLPRAAVSSNQRSRLLAAMVATVAERGYEATNVAHVVERSGVSRTAFYRLFANKEACFVTAVDEIVAFSSISVTEAWQAPGDWSERLRKAFETFVDEIVSQPAAARVCLLDVYAAGETAIDHANQGMAMFERMVGQSLEQSPSRAGMPPLVVRAIVGGIHKVIMTRVRRGEAESLPALVPDLWEWANSYEAPPVPLRAIRPTTDRARVEPPAGSDPVARMCSALAKTTAEQGYAAARIEDIVAEASVSLSTFYDHFGTKEEAFLAAFDQGMANAMTASLPAFERASEWIDSVCLLGEAMLEHLAAEGAWARMGIVEALAAGPRAMERRDAAMAVFEALLQPGLEEHSEVPPIAAEAISGGVYSLLYDEIRSRGTDRLTELAPIATFFSLAPFVGSSEATTIANERH